jgi:hypothetical protein
MKILRLLVTGAVTGDTINYTQQLLPLNSLMLGISYCCDFRANPNYSVVSTNGILSVTPKYCCNSNSRWQIKSIRDENPALTAVVTGAVNGDTINYTQQLLPLNSLMLGTILLL